MAQPNTLTRSPVTQLTLLPMKKTTFSLPQDLYRQLKIESVKRDIEMSTLVTEALRQYLSEDSK
jgi:metal-responsive CopG/Arc/MetJ family transcriptional regulator